jgi:hypothetical protein
MPKSSFVDFKAVKAAITMEQVLEHYGLLDKFKRGKDSANRRSCSTLIAQTKKPADKPLVIVEGFFGCMKLH